MRLSLGSARYRRSNEPISVYRGATVRDCQERRFSAARATSDLVHAITCHRHNEPIAPRNVSWVLCSLRF